MDPLVTLNDTELVKQMKECYYEKYKTLVRMHLSFELELNTDEFDLPSHEIVYEDKGKLKKWNRLSKKHKVTAGCSSTAKSAGNSPTEGLGQQIDAGFIFHLAELKEFLLLEKNLKQEGIFRKTGSSSRQNELRLHIQNEAPLNLNAAGFSAHDCATVFKSYLAELAEPLLTDAHYPAHLQIAPLCIGISFNGSTSSMRPERIKREQRLLNSMQYLLLLLPDDNRNLLIHIIDILNAVLKFESLNKMSADNLATLFAPHLICPRNLPPEALHYLSKKLSSIIAYMINKGSEIFEVPAKLLTDIRAYFLCKRKKTISPEKTLDDSISDISTVNTVYTFVDRERTAAAHTANNTDTELAQLYAHIQSLPESSKKRRLIKQFNKQNGQGTPLQLVVKNRLKNSEATRSAKSISDSIKKHIFHRGIMSRTPKRSNANLKTPTPVDVETPNYSNTKKPKLRVLFQSPATSNMPTPNIATNTSLKMHPLQKSISSTSLLLNSSTRNPHIYQHVNSKQKNDEIETSTSSSSCGSSTNSNDDPHSQQQMQLKTTLKIDCDAPKDKKTHIINATDTSNEESTQMTAFETQKLQTDRFVTSLNFKAEDSENLISNTTLTKKSVAWNDQQPLNKANKVDSKLSNAFKSRYKSEPNLSSILNNNKQFVETPKTVQSNIEKSNTTAGKSITQKLIKGVSMSNLKFPLVRSVSSISKRRHSDENKSATNKETISTYLYDHRNVFHHDELETLDDKNFNDHIDTDSDEFESENETLETAEDTKATNESNSCDITDHGGFATTEAYDQILVQPTGLYRNIDLITSTPALLLGRRSMSPITKSAQRMPKSMQESIMTPRSRKPVMVFTATTSGPTDQNQTIYENEISNFNKQAENKIPTQSNVYDKNIVSNTLTKQRKTHFGALEGNLKTNEALTDDFKKYLRSRSVFTESPPVDSSFSSHSDDFRDDDDDDESTKEFVNLNESQLSPSLLYCLNGNEPLAAANVKDAGAEKFFTNENSSSSNETFDTPPSHIILKNRFKRCDTKHKRFDNALKRGATSTVINKENEQNTGNEYLITKKMFMSDSPNETSF